MAREGTGKTRGASSFKETDARRAVAAAHKAGLKVTCIEFALDGRIALTVEDGGGVKKVITHRNNEWDEVFQDGDDQA